MITKLTLTLEDETIKRAKEFAKENGKSLSALVEAYFKLLTKTKKTIEKDKLTEKVSAIYGSVILPKDFDYKSELEKAINEKHNV
jgi:hypothetical protein